MLLSDNAFNYPFLKFTTKWLKGKIQYTNLRPYTKLISQEIDWITAPVSLEGIGSFRQRVTKNGGFIFEEQFDFPPPRPDAGAVEIGYRGLARLAGPAGGNDGPGDRARAPRPTASPGRPPAAPPSASGTPAAPAPPPRLNGVRSVSSAATRQTTSARSTVSSPASRYASLRSAVPLTVNLCSARASRCSACRCRMKSSRRGRSWRMSRLTGRC